MTVPINEPIVAGVVFGRHQLQPSWFLWNGRRVPVREVTQRWQTREGRAMILHLGVTDGSTCFELVFNQDTLRWSLAAVDADR